MFKNKIVTISIILIGIVFLIFPICVDSYNHYLQNSAYNKAHDRVIECRAELALSAIDHRIQIIEKKLDKTCGVIPKFDEFTPDETLGVLSFYNWIAQKITFIPL